MSSTAHLDALLALVTYISTFLASTLITLPSPSASTSTRRASLLALSALFSNLRSSLRLFGLLGIYTWALSLWNSPPPDRILWGIAWAQVFANVAFQALENVAVLADKGVLRKGWEGEVGRVRKGRLWRWSSRAWLVHVGLEVGRLGRVWRLGVGRRTEGEGEVEGKGKGTGAGAGEEKGKGLIVRDEVADEVALKPEHDKTITQEQAKAKETEKWWRDILLNAAYAPMSMHWSVEEGILAEPWLGALGLTAAGIGFRQAWRETK